MELHVRAAIHVMDDICSLRPRNNPILSLTQKNLRLSNIHKLFLSYLRMYLPYQASSGYQFLLLSRTKHHHPPMCRIITLPPQDEFHIWVSSDYQVQACSNLGMSDWILLSRSGILNGFGRTSCMPASLAVWICSLRAFAVTPRISCLVLIVPSLSSSLILLVACSPSRTGLVYS